MRTSVLLNDVLLRKAREATGIQEKTALIHLGLEALVRKAAIDRLIKLGGSDPRARPIRRRRSA